MDIGYHHAAPLAAASFNNFNSPVCPNGTGSISLSGVNYGWNNTTPDWWGLPVTYSITSQPQHGSLTNTDNAGDYSYTPTNCYEGSDSFMYQMSDGLFTSPPAVVYLMVADTFNNTYYTPSPAQTPVNTALTITITPRDSCGDATNVVITGHPAHGTLSTLSGNPPQTNYTPTNNFNGIDSFVFQVGNGCGDVASFLAFITVTNSGTGGPFTLVTNITGGPVGIDYSPTENVLIVSANSGDSDFGGDEFVQLGTNGAGALTVTNFSGINGLSAYGEVEVATVKQNVNGFTNGNVFFSSGFNVGWLSGDGTQSNLDWSTLTNNTVINNKLIHGGIYVDQTGIFSNELIVLTGDNNGAPSRVWLANSNGIPTLLAQIEPQIVADPGDNLEGVISLTNNPNQWGPWAGKILTGDENYGILYAIDTNGTVTPYDLGIEPDHFVLIPANQDLYACDYGGRVIKLSRTFLTNYVGDLLVTQEGGGSSYPTELCIVNWGGTNFVTRAINGNVVTNGIGQFEDTTFSPLNLPSQPIR